MNDARLIDALGGPAKLAALLGFDRGGVQRVHNWRTRGIPAKVKLARPDLFSQQAQQKLERSTASPGERRAEDRRQADRRSGGGGEGI